MPKKETSANDPAKAVADHDWEERKLCSDGNCIGVIGPDGTCKECGKPYQGKPFHDDPRRSADEGEDALTDAENPGNRTDESENRVNANIDIEWESRKLCSDGNCIGVIGPDGTCKECGKPYESDS